MKKDLIKTTKIIILGSILIVGVASAQNWIGPTSPPTGNNVSAPISATPGLLLGQEDYQHKSGPLVFDTLVVSKSFIADGGIILGGRSSITNGDLIVNGDLNALDPSLPFTYTSTFTGGLTATKLSLSSLVHPGPGLRPICAHGGKIDLCPMVVVPQTLKGPCTYYASSNFLQTFDLTSNCSGISLPSGTKLRVKMWGGGGFGGGGAGGGSWGGGGGGGGGAGGYDEFDVITDKTKYDLIVGISSPSGVATTGGNGGYFTGSPGSPSVSQLNQVKSIFDSGGSGERFVTGGWSGLGGCPASAPTGSCYGWAGDATSTQGVGGAGGNNGTGSGAGSHGEYASLDGCPSGSWTCKPNEGNTGGAGGAGAPGANGSSYGVGGSGGKSGNGDSNGWGDNGSPGNPGTDGKIEVWWYQ